MYAVSFAVVMVVLNVQAISQQAGYVRNQFSDRDEVLETQLLSNFYRELEVERRSIVPVEVENYLIADNSILIPKTNTRAPIIWGRSTNPDAILEELKNGTVLYPDSSLPGQGGTTVILGHSSSNLPWNEYSNVFSLLHKLEAGDFIYLKYRGDFYVYRVDQKLTGSVFTLAKTDIQGDLVLSSCWPVGSDQGRILITAALQK